MFPEAEKWTQDGSINLKGPLAGIPVSLKDSIVVGGYDASVGYSGKCFKPLSNQQMMFGVVVRTLTTQDILLAAVQVAKVLFSLSVAQE